MKITTEERDSVTSAGRISEVIKDISSKPAITEGESDDSKVDIVKMTKKLVNRRSSNLKKTQKGGK